MYLCCEFFPLSFDPLGLLVLGFQAAVGPLLLLFQFLMHPTEMCKHVPALQAVKCDLISSGSWLKTNQIMVVN